MQSGKLNLLMYIQLVFLSQHVHHQVQQLSVFLKPAYCKVFLEFLSFNKFINNTVWKSIQDTQETGSKVFLPSPKCQLSCLSLYEHFTSSNTQAGLSQRSRLCAPSILPISSFTILGILRPPLASAVCPNVSAPHLRLRLHPASYQFRHPTSKTIRAIPV